MSEASKPSPASRVEIAVWVAFGLGLLIAAVALLVSMTMYIGPHDGGQARAGASAWIGIGLVLAAVALVAGLILAGLRRQSRKPHD